MFEELYNKCVAELTLLFIVSRLIFLDGKIILALYDMTFVNLEKH